jgi:type I restriction enzyme R subunit
MNTKEAQSRIKINRLLEEADWRFFDDEKGPANIQLEMNVKIREQDLDAFGEDFESTRNGFIDFLLLDERGFPFVVLEAKREGKDPLDGKEQSRKYAKSLNVRFVILSNGNIHYFWDLEQGNPQVITEFPTPESIGHRKSFNPDAKRLAEATVDHGYIAQSQKPGYEQDPSYQNPETRSAYIQKEGLRILRDYQLLAIRALQKAAAKGKDRFLFEMATGTGKTLVSAAVIKLFLQTENAKRVLFLVDRLELETQAWKNFKRYLSKDYTTVIYKQSRDDWKKAEIVVSTIQSFTSQDKYKTLFSPTDFDLVISDESHRSIGGNSRAVFEYFIGYKLGLTATPKNYLKNIDAEKLNEMDPRAWERRQLLDTYITFGCESGEPTYRYSLVDGVKEGFLINPVVADARTDITAELLSENGYAVVQQNEEGVEEEDYFYGRDFERKFFSPNTNVVFCETFMKNALWDPLSGEIGKSIIFCVSQNHAADITKILNEMAYKIWPDKYHSDFAVQVTSRIPGAQEMTVNFSNNNLNGHTRFLENYKSSKTRVCVTVSMMTTGYDCEDILNLAMMRPIFSPTDFIQIKGRGTRRWAFEYEDAYGTTLRRDKANFKLFDFFANCEFFEHEYNYDEILELPILSEPRKKKGSTAYFDNIEIFDPDKIKRISEKAVGAEGMRIDREFFAKAKAIIQEDGEISMAVSNAQWERAISIIREKYENRPELFMTLEKLQKSENLDRRLTWREFLERVFGLIDKFKSKDEKLEEECEKFIAIHKPDSKYVPYIKNFLKAYVTDAAFRDIINQRRYGDLNFHTGFSKEEFRALNGWRDIIPEYAKDYISFNMFAA